MKTHIWYCAELNRLEYSALGPISIFKIKGWKKYVFFRFKNFKKSTAFIEYVYVGEL